MCARRCSAMKVSAALMILALFSAVASLALESHPGRYYPRDQGNQDGAPSDAQIISLAPQLGFQAGKNPDGESTSK